MSKFENKIFFITGCARSGTTSISKILALAENTEMHIEPVPNFNVESRDMMDGKLQNPHSTISSTILRISPILDNGKIYGEKNVTLVPFIEELSNTFNSRFLFLIRDGRDVVRSLMDWNNRMFGTIYRECKDYSSLSERAKNTLKTLAVKDDFSDYQRPRPGPEDIWFDSWENFSRFEMCTWYWSRYNEILLKKAALLDKNRYFFLDYTKPKSSDIKKVFNFLGLELPQQKKIEQMLGSRINSIKDRIGEKDEYPQWRDWTPLQRVFFDNIAAKTMQKLGFYSKTRFIRYCPPNYGDWWRKNDGGLAWYEWMYENRRAAHENLISFIKEKDNSNEKFESILDVGCGLAVGYADHLANRRYVGMDLSGKEAKWCKQNRQNDKHQYINADIVRKQFAKKFDLVFSQGTIDNSYDINAMIRAMVLASKGWIYITAYRGWFEKLPEHRYKWDETTTCFYNDISAKEVFGVLEEMGCSNISITPLDMGIRKGNPIRFETRIVAKAPN